MNITNPKAIFIDGVWCIVDAPMNKPDCAGAIMCLDPRKSKCYCSEYKDLLFKAPRWKVKEQEQMRVIMADIIDPHNKPIPKEGRVYDLPAGFSVKIVEEKQFVQKYPNGNHMGIAELVEVALLIPEEEVMSERIKN